MKKLIFTFILLISLTKSVAQENKFGLGIGYGQMFGGFGIQLNYEAITNLEIYSGLGYNLSDFAYNVGVKYRFTENRTRPFLTAMYGYNAVVLVPDISNLNKSFNGATFGFGIDLKSRKNDNFWTFAALIPLRSDEVEDYKKILSNNYNLTFTDFFPITISVGYIFKI
jgi:hypothetical protein